MIFSSRILRSLLVSSSVNRVYPLSSTVLRSYSVTNWRPLSLRVKFNLLLKNSMSTISGDPKFYERLPRNVIPLVYKIQLKPDLERFTFSGKEEIQVSVKEDTNQVIVNAAEIEIQKAAFKYESGDSLAGQVTIDEKEEKAFIKFGEHLKPGEGTLSLSFTGILNDKMKGFYRTQYENEKGEIKYAATTQFEPPDARRAFPCWDEPAFKAQFEVTMIAPKDRTVLSNTDPVKEYVHSEDGNLKVVEFGRTPVMSTYLVAFVIGEYEFIETTTERGTRVRVFTPLGKKEQGKFALDVAAKSLVFFEKYFNITFPLNKLDHIGIPDFASGAMENWGLITYRMERVLIDSSQSSALMHEYAAITICHETAHQWFGNLVTMDWWNDLWLNEGFASFMEFVSTDAVLPSYDVWNQISGYAILPSLQSDSYCNSHPIEVPVHHPDDIDSIFDNISYGKGCCIIRMLHKWIGDDAFREGLNKYLTKYSYGNAVTQNLWDSLEAASSKPVGKVMSTWTKQMGFPIVTVESRQDGNNRILKLTQQKFSADGELTAEERNMTWMIPIFVSTSVDPSKEILSTLMISKNCEVVLEDVPADAWVKVNPRFIGFYRVNYPDQMLESLKGAIRSKKLGPLDRVEIVSDLFASALAGKCSTKSALEMISAYSNEDDYTVIAVIDDVLGKLGSLCEYTDYGEKLVNCGLDLYTKLFNKLGFDPSPSDSHTDGLLRSLVLHRLGKYKYQPVIDEALKRFKEHVAGKPIHPDLRGSIYSIVAAHGDDETYDLFFKLYRDVELVEEKNRLIISAGATHSPNRIRKLLNFAISDAVRSQDCWRVVIRTAHSSRSGREESWKFFKANADEFWRRHGSHLANARLIEAIISDFASTEAAKEVEQFFIEKPFSGHELVILRGLESIKVNADWVTRENANLKTYLNAKYPG